MSIPVQAAIVAGGRGVRMRPATDLLPKPMLPVAGKPALEHLVEWLRRSGISQAFMCLGYRAEAISSYFGDGAKWGVRLEYQVESSPRGTAGSVGDLADRVRGDLLVVYGDLFVDLDARRLLEFHRGHDGLATVVVRKTDHPLDSDLVRVSDGRIVDFHRAEPGRPHGELACTALFVARPALLARIPRDRPSDFGRDVFPEAVRAGETLIAYPTSEEICDVGTPERVEAFERRRR